MSLIGAVAKSIYSNGRFFNFGAIRDYIATNDGYILWPFSTMLSASPQFNNYIGDLNKLNAVLKSPAMLKVFALQCDLFSLGKVYVYDRNGKLLDNDPAYNRLSSPNPFQTQSQLLWDFMFWDMLGNAYLYADSRDVNNDNAKMYWLTPHKMEWPQSFLNNTDRMVFSRGAVDELSRTIITYRYDSGKPIPIPLSQIVCITDLTNGTGNWWKGPSRIDALYKIISNSELLLDGLNINAEFAKKFIIAGQSDPNNVKDLPMTEPEKQSIEDKMRGRKQVHAVKSMIEIQRFVEDMRSLNLDGLYLSQYFLIGSMYGIPKDVLEAYNSSTYENQEKARAAHISYCLQPKGNDLMERLARHWGYTAQGKRIEMAWDHLPMMNVFEKDRSETNRKNAETLRELLKLGVPLAEINELLDTNFTEAKYEQQSKQAGSATTTVG
jgi:hypothetical protein